MALRLIEIVAPADCADQLQEQADSADTLGVWRQELSPELVMFRVLVEADRTEAVTDAVQEQFGQRDSFRLMLLAVEATLPVVEPPEEAEAAVEAAKVADQAAAAVQGEGDAGETEDGDASDDSSDAEPSSQRVAREELYESLQEGARVKPVQLAMVLLSSIVAAVGLMRDDVTILIGAMVLAPLLTPNMALALGTTLGDLGLVRKALRANLVASAAAFSFAVVLGLVLPVDAGGEQIDARTHARFSDAALALAAGSAGALAFTTGVPVGLVGVMVAVALLPPWITAGLLLGAGQTSSAGGAILLVLVNVISVNLAAVVTFWSQGVRPRNWWEADAAAKATRYAVAIWSTLLLVLIALIWFSRRYGGG